MTSNHRNMSPEELRLFQEKILLLRSQGYTVTEIGRQTGRSQSSVTRHLKALGASLKSPWLGKTRIARHPNANAARKRTKECSYCYPNEDSARIHVEFTVELATDKLAKTIRGFQRSDIKYWLEEDLETFLGSLSYSDQQITKHIIYIHGIEER